MAYADALSLARLWLLSGGRTHIQLSALEPLLWRDGSLGTSDLVRGLTQMGFEVSITTNGSLLKRHAFQLKEAGLDLLRISWHTTNPSLFNEISGGGNYAEFERGIEEAAKAGLNISFNRILLRGRTNDLHKQLAFVIRHGLRLKLYNMYWTPELKGVYDDFYQDWRPVVREHVLPLTNRIERLHAGTGRARLRFHLAPGGFVEVKLGEKLHRSEVPCSTCPHQSRCLEQFGDYVRVEPDLSIYFCYLRRDFGFPCGDLLGSTTPDYVGFKRRLFDRLGNLTEQFLRSSSLSYNVVPFCNFNCFVPGTKISWCLMTPGTYSFPKPKHRDEGVARTQELVTIT